ncbi:MAG TPA: EamA family transporter [Candidatus Limnocylindrales bacterium]|nr:EamA family transporter [Candidatus Limnocylindrales bacterium]
MPPFVLALIVVAAVLHAGWNVLLKTSGDTLLTSVRLQAIGTLILAPIGVVAWLLNGAPALDPTGLAVAFASAILEALYFILLASAYSRGDLSLVYPLARGTAPMLAVLFAVLVLGERLDPVASVGVALVIAGILLVSRPWQALGEAGRRHRGAVGFAIATGVTIAAYSAVDRVGVRLIEAWQYGVVLAVLATSILATIVFVGRRTGWLATPEPTPEAIERSPLRRLGRDAVAGVLALTAYLLILIAYSVAPLAVVSPLRESAIVLGAAWGSIRLGEAAGRREAGVRIGAAATVVVGAVLIALG